MENGCPYPWRHLLTSPSAFPLSQISTFSILVPYPLTHPLLTSIGQYYGPHFCNLCKKTSCYSVTLHLAVKEINISACYGQSLHFLVVATMEFHVRESCRWCLGGRGILTYLG